jgi:serine/threonine protein kinase
MQKRTEWEEIRPLGGGGQSDVFLVRTPKRKAERESCLDRLGSMSGTVYDSNGAAEFAEAAWNYARTEELSELGALKVFKIPPQGVGLSPMPGSKEFEAIARLKNEIGALGLGLPGLPRLLDSCEEERWIVTEYFPELTLEHHPLKYKGRVLPALKAFRSLVQTVAALHGQRLVHRDIKPANVFIRNDELVLGDFGIVYVPSAPDKVTLTGERVGPRDYMPPWANLGVRHQNVHPRDDVYMLGKLLWCMLDGRAVLPREYHKHPELDFDLTKTFPDDPHMHLVNSILNASVVEQADKCLAGAQDLFIAVETTISIIERGGQLLGENVPRPCHVCGRGNYSVHSAAVSEGNLRIWTQSNETKLLQVRLLSCDACGHVQIFKVGERLGTY